MKTRCLILLLVNIYFFGGVVCQNLIAQNKYDTLYFQTNHGYLSGNIIIEDTSSGQKIVLRNRVEGRYWIPVMFPLNPETRVLKVYVKAWYYPFKAEAFLRVEDIQGRYIFIERPLPRVIGFGYGERGWWKI